MNNSKYTESILQRYSEEADILVKYVKKKTQEKKKPYATIRGCAYQNVGMGCNLTEIMLLALVREQKIQVEKIVTGRDWSRKVESRFTSKYERVHLRDKVLIERSIAENEYLRR